MAVTTTLGREAIRQALPEKWRGWADRTLDKKAIGKLTTEMALEDPDAYVDTLQRLNAVGERTVTRYGRDAALSYMDAAPGKELDALRARLRAKVDAILDAPGMTGEQREEAIRALGYQFTQKVQDAVFEDQDRRHTALAAQINSGSRGNRVQLMQMLFGNMMMKDALNRDISYLHTDPFVYGTSPMAYWVSASSGRKGMYDVQAATGQAGYLGKQVTNVTHDVAIEAEDCGTTDTGVPFAADDPQNLGRVLLRPFHGHAAGEVVDRAMLKEAKPGEEMVLRTPMTCKCAHGVCARCNGLSENGRFPAVGDMVALNSARAFVEKVTQAGISCLAPTTMVRMADGSVRAIADIREGDMVVGVGMDGVGRPSRVTRVYRHGHMPMLRLVFATGDRRDPAVLVCTDRHKVLGSDGLGAGLVTMASGMRSATPLRRAEGLSEAHDGEWELESAEFAGTLEAYDIEVDHPDHLFLLGNGLVVSNSKHSGGVGGKRVVDPDGEDQPTGFRNMERMFTAPKAFPGGAVLSPDDGRVEQIRPAPQGGTYITVGGKVAYAGPARTVTVKVGDTVERGDMLTNGVPNPMEVVAARGLGEARVWYMGKLADVFRRSGFGVDRSNLESFSRAMLNKVRVTAPEGYGAWLPGEVAPYSEVAAEWRPRDSARELKASDAVGMYLERPALNYTLGTRVTPKVAKALESRGFGQVLASPDPLPFEPEFMRPAAALQNDRNWLPRLSGERLYDSLFDAARRGMTDSWDSASYVDKIVASPFRQDAATPRQEPNRHA